MNYPLDPPLLAAVPGNEALLSFFEGVPFQMGISELTPDHDMLLVSVNPVAAAVLGRTAAEVQGKRISELGLAGPGKGVWLAEYLQAYETGKPVNFEQMSGIPGHEAWWEITLAHIGAGPSGQPRFAWVVRDISERKREEGTRGALYRISEAAQSEATLPALFARIHEIIGTLLPAKNFFVALRDADSNMLSFPYHVDEYDPAPEDRVLDDGTLSGRVIRLGIPLLFTPETPNEGVHQEDRIIGAPSIDWLGVPLKTQAGTIGALVVQSYDGKVRYTERDMGLLEFVSGQVASAIERKQAGEEARAAAVLEQDRGQVLEQVVQNVPLSAVLHRVAESIEHQRRDTLACVLMLRQGSWKVGAAPSLPARFAAEVEALPITELAGSFAAASVVRAPVFASDTQADAGWSALAPLCRRYRIRRCWSVPILAAGGAALGTLCLVGSAAREAGEADRALLESMARLVAVAIEHRQLTDELSYQAHHDALTALPNRQLFQDRLGQALAQAKRSNRQVAVLYMDIDRFKQINDTLGHSSGDELLRQAAARLGNCIRGSDTLARLGGDEFTVVLSELGGGEAAMRVARKMVEAMRAPFSIGGRELFVTMSLGISIHPDDGADAESLMANADAAMYRAKELGRDNFQWFAAEMNVLARERMELESHLRHALQMGDLSLAYQPQCKAGGRIFGFEALMRWRHPTLGDISPSRFIPLAEESGLIVPMGEWALRQACAQTVAWQRAGNEGLRISVNVSAAQFNRPDWVDTVRHALRDTGLSPAHLELEITESLLLQSARETAANLFELRALGVSVAIDDFGTGYSSLSYLHKLPISTLKIDQSFVREIGMAPMHGQGDAPVIRTIIALAHNLGMKVVAEGVETEEQRRVLVALGCEGLQGFLLHRPLDVAAATAVLEAVRKPSGGVA
jgi:diguanylate cyclase (GGDEF)-like protein/PAS domain S-box-containing protein